MEIGSIVESWARLSFDNNSHVINGVVVRRNDQPRGAETKRHLAS